MTGPIMPAEDEWPALVPTRGSVTWRKADDPRLVAGSGYALLLQVAHPTVGAGVADHSNFREDPWGRLLRTLDYVNGSIYGGPRMAGEIGRRVRAMHQTIKGTTPDGRPYHALEPDAYAWVHATLASSIVDGHAAFGTPFTAAEAEDFWVEWVRLGRLIGVRERDLPATWSVFRPYFDAVVADTLVRTEMVDVVLDTLLHPARPHRAIPHRLWRVLRTPAGHGVRLGTAGLLGPELRDRFGVRWTPVHQLAFRAVGGVARATGPLMVGPAREVGPRYVRARQAALARGDVAAAPR